MAEAKLLKSVRVVEPVQGINFDGTRYPGDVAKRVKNAGDGVRMDVYQKGRRKYAFLSRFGIQYEGDTAGPTDYFPDETTGHKFDKVDQSLPDDEVIKYALLEVRGKWYTALGGIDIKDMIMQDPWKDTPPTRRHYGFTYYYLNDGSQIHIEWLKNSFVASSYYDNADDVGVTKKLVTIFPYSKSHGTEGLPPELKDQSDASTRGIVKYQREDGTIDYGDKIEYSEQKNWGQTEDDTIVQIVLDQIKRQIREVTGDWQTAEKLKLCDPDSDYCKLIKHIDFNTPPPPKTTEEVAKEEIKQITASQSTTGTIKLTIDGLPEKIEIKAKENLPNFKVWSGEIPVQINDAKELTDIEELDEEFQEGAIHTDEEQIKLDLTVYLEQGDSEGDEETTGSGSGGGGGGGTETTPTGSGVNTKGSSAGGAGNRRFQTQLTIKGRVVKNGELPDDLLAKVDFGGYKLEKHAAAKFSALNTAFKAKFGKNFTISGPYRPFEVQNSIFDWPLFESTGKGRKVGTNGGVAAAKPGTSKHGWGQAMDIGGMGNGPGNQYFDWMEQNAKNYGWINPAWAKVRGAGYEPWHWEYIGNDLFT